MQPSLSRIFASFLLLTAQLLDARSTEPQDEAVARRGSPIAQAVREAITPDSPEFLAREATVRLDFLTRYPLSKKGELGKYLSTVKLTDQQSFDASVAEVAKDRLVPLNQKPPAYWRVLLASIVGTQDMGFEAIPKLILGHADESQPDPRSIDNLAKQNWRFYRAVALQYGGAASPGAFDSSPPLMQSQYIMAGLKGALGDLSFPCPYSVFVLDIEEPSQDDEPDLARKFYAGLAGRDNDDYTRFGGYNRQQKTYAFKRAFGVLIDEGYEIARRSDENNLNNLLKLFEMRSERNGRQLFFVDLSGKRYTERDAVFSIFGFDGRKEFDQTAEGPAKNDMLAAAVLLIGERDRLGPLFFG